MLQKTNIPGYMKDETTKAIINTDNNELTQYRAARDKILEINSLNIKVDKMAHDIDDLKTMLTQLLEKAS